MENQQEAFAGVFGFLWVLQVLLYQHLSCVDVACILETRKRTWSHNEHQRKIFICMLCVLMYNNDLFYLIYFI